MAPSIESEVQQRLILSEKDKTILFIIAGYTVGIFVLWNLQYVKYILHPFKLIVVRISNNFSLIRI